MQYLDNLIEACKEAKKVKPKRKFVMSGLDELKDIKLDELKNIKLDELKDIKNAVYVISELGGDPLETFEAFRTFKANTEWKCPRRNDPNSILYVGSSATDLKRRIREHLGNGSTSTYALNLLRWFGKRRLKIEVSVYDVSVSKQVLQLVEDAKSFELEPAFGKRGGNNK